MNSLIQSLKVTHNLDRDAQIALENHLSFDQMDKGELLLKTGQVCHRLYFIEQGAVRGYYYAEGKEITHWFGFETDIVTSFHSFIQQNPSVENIETIEPLTAWSISRKDLYALYDKHPSIERLGRLTCEKYYVRLEERYVNAHFKTALKRYQDLLNQSSHIIQRVPLGQIASYLGISQETLSRIRSKA